MHVIKAFVPQHFWRGNMHNQFFCIFYIQKQPLTFTCRIVTSVIQNADMLACCYTSLLGLAR